MQVTFPPETLEGTQGPWRCSDAGASREISCRAWGKRAVDGVGLPPGQRPRKQGKRTALGSHVRGTAERGRDDSWLSDPERPGERGLGALEVHLEGPRERGGRMVPGPHLERGDRGDRGPAREEGDRAAWGSAPLAGLPPARRTHLKAGSSLGGRAWADAAPPPLLLKSFWSRVGAMACVHAAARAATLGDPGGSARSPRRPRRDHGDGRGRGRPEE